MSRKNKRRRTALIPPRSFEFNPDYSLIKRDLKRIGILAGTFILILVVLSFFQDQIIALFVK